MNKVERAQLIQNRLASTELFVTTLAQVLVFDDSYKIVRGLLDRVAEQLRLVQQDVASLGLIPEAEIHVTEFERTIARTKGKIPAIRAVRERLDLGLKEAKDLVEKEITDFGPPRF